ncbi:DBIRD complex subunit ZNF326-like [Hippocampus zosterae]|uniref:DBIRD complex subunit ZNF326-like n=1 Tax=Hippocampus zosterae TaxID=109293 RepID=UPI00223E2151|nr:DBIRD complex subunit ZNF326-like [Hippocampus zosterae]
MNPDKNVSYSNTSQLAATGTRKRVGWFSEQQRRSRVPEDLRASMMHIPTRDKAEPKSTIASSAVVTGARAAQLKTQPVQATAGKWKSSFKLIEPENPEEASQRQSSDERTDIYDPVDPPMEDFPKVNFCGISCDSPPKQDDNPEWQRSLPEQDNNLDWQSSPREQNGDLEWQRMSPDRSGRDSPMWMSDRSLDVHDFGPESNLGRCRLSERRSSSPDMKSTEFLQYGRSRRSFSPDSRSNGSSSLRYAPPYGGKRTNGEEMSMPEYRSPMIPRVRLSSPPLQQDDEIEGPSEAEPEHNTGMPRTRRQMRRSVQMDQITINCDLCDVEVSNGQELEKHLQSKIHWDTMEHIQEQNNYDDMTIAFLQDVMLYKSIKCSRAIDYSTLQALQEDDHMTKVSLFHCAACQVLVSTAAVAVQNHITSPEHLSNNKEFEAQQRRTSLATADTIMKELQPQFENFVKGFSQFE